MQFLADVFVPCDQCDGKRFRPQVLEVGYKGRSIDQVLNMTVREALAFFGTSPKVLRRLQQLGASYRSRGHLPEQVKQALNSRPDPEVERSLVHRIETTMSRR